MLAYLGKRYTGLRLQINAAKRAVAGAFGRKFPGHALRVAQGKEVRLAVSKKALHNVKTRIRDLTRRSNSRSMQQMAEDRCSCLLGWEAYFARAQTPKGLRTLGEWMRHRLRAMQLKQRKRSRTILREPRALGATEVVAKRVCGNSRCWWRNSDGRLKTTPTIACFDRLAVARL